MMARREAEAEAPNVAASATSSNVQHAKEKLGTRFAISTLSVPQDRKGRCTPAQMFRKRKEEKAAVWFSVIQVRW